MYSKQDQNLILYQKAKQKIRIHLIVYFILLCLYFIGIHYAFGNIQFLNVESSQFDNGLNILTILQIVIFGLLFFMLSKGNKIFRIVYLICSIASFALIYFPISILMDHLESILALFICIACMAIKSIVLMNMYGYLKKDRWCKIYYDHTIELEDEDDDWVERQTQKADIHKIREKYQNKFESSDEEDEYEAEKAPLTLPQFSVRLGILIYGSLIVFPIFVQIFSGLFESLDMQKVFATKDIFIFCIFTAFIWTIPLFYMYYNQKASKKIIAGCMVAEIIRIIVYAPTFIQYYKGGDYSIRVFIFFAILDAIRLIILFIFAIKILLSKQEYATNPKD